jgi:hypothetical protein
MKNPASTDLGLLVDEGMWTFDNPPNHLLRKHYGFVASPKWLEAVRLSAVRFNDGGSGSFVSARGLVLTNHHVALGQLHKMSTPRRDYVAMGFYAKKLQQEIPCPDLELNQLVSLTNVTTRVTRAAARATSPREANEQRKAKIAEIEKYASESSGLRSDVVELYQGAEYWLYQYKKHTDIRLVMAPEVDTAFFGGDTDNFSYPRHALDFAFFRVYEDGRPVRPKHFFRWSKAGAKEGELTFVVGHPGSTDRQLTVAQLEYLRDIAIPKRLAMYERRRDAVLAYAQRGKEQARRGKDYLFGLENALKVVSGEHERLREGPILEKKAAVERTLRARVKLSPALHKEVGGSWDRIADARALLAKRHKQITFRRLSGHRLTWMADTLVRYVAEVDKPNSKRLEEFRDSHLESLHHRLFSPAPVFADLEEVLLAAGLDEARAELGPKDPFVVAALGRRTPAEVAREAVRGTKLGDVSFRRALAQGGRAAVETSRDPLVALARRVDRHYRQMRRYHEDHIESVERQEGDRIGRARFALVGKRIYPDATFTLRLAYGRPLGYEWDKTRVPYHTTFYGLFDRAASFGHAPPYRIPPAVMAARGRLALDTPLNFVSTHDITGGNSGSPVVNARRELVGLIFDGNVQSFANSYAYDNVAARAVSVDSRGIMEALRAIYRMTGLVRELSAG